MKKALIIILILALLAAIAYIILLKNGYNDKSILNTSETYDLSVSCSEINNMLVTSEVTVMVKNNSSRTHNNVTVRVTAYDGEGEVIKVKIVKFDRTLKPSGKLSKPVTLPAKTKQCDCVLEDSDPR